MTNDRTILIWINQRSFRVLFPDHFLPIADLLNPFPYHFHGSRDLRDGWFHLSNLLESD